MGTKSDILTAVSSIGAIKDKDGKAAIIDETTLFGLTLKVAKLAAAQDQILTTLDTQDDLIAKLQSSIDALNKK